MLLFAFVMCVAIQSLPIVVRQRRNYLNQIFMSGFYNFISNYSSWIFNPYYMVFICYSMLKIIA